MNMDMHAWKLAGPWYRWTRPGVPRAGRQSAPALQKYDGPGFVKEFLNDPQHSLKFTAEDFVHEVRQLPPLTQNTYGTPPKARRLSSLGYFPTTTRKLFLDTHKRFYLIVCELHCDTTGFPSVKRDQVCDTGFVIRRRIIRNLTAPALAEVKPVFERMAFSQRAMTELATAQPEAGLGIMNKILPPQGAAMLAGALNDSIDKNQNALLGQVVEDRAKVARWARKYNVELRLQGWQHVRDGIGNWIDVAETSAKPPVEEILPLYPLIPDPREPKHSGKGRTIYFGVVPTSSADTDELGTAKFDDATQYEIRCFVRGYKHPTAPGAKPCCGETVWSLPTEVYQLASHFDLVGTSNRPVSMQLPDLSALEAQAAALPPNQLAPFRMVSPPKSNLEVTADKDGKVTSHGVSDQTCSFSIPLITIVATFVLQLFLPVVTLLFGLFFMLKLKFCIPPSISLSGGLAADLKLALQGGLDASVDAQVELGTPLGDNLDAQLRRESNLGNAMVDGLRSGTPDRPGGFSSRVLAEMTDSIQESGVETNAPSLTAKLTYEDHVEAEVFA